MCRWNRRDGRLMWSAPVSIVAHQPSQRGFERCTEEQDNLDGAGGACSRASRWLASVATGQRTPRNLPSCSSGVPLLPSCWACPRYTSSRRSPPWLAIWATVAALVWVLGVAGALTIPPTPLAGMATLHLPALSNGTGLPVGAAPHSALVRHRLKKDGMDGASGCGSAAV